MTGWGHGIYFWENNPKRALEWARQRRFDGSRLREPFVIGAIIDPGHCLNLLESRSLDLIGLVHGELAATVSSADLPRNQGLRRNLDCAVVNLACALMARADKPYDTVRSVFLEGGEIYPTSSFSRHAHVQMCVRNPDCIAGYFRPIASR